MDQPCALLVEPVTERYSCASGRPQSDQTEPRRCTLKQPIAVQPVTRILRHEVENIASREWREILCIDGTFPYSDRGYRANIGVKRSRRPPSRSARRLDPCCQI